MMKRRLLLTLVLGCTMAGCSKKATETYEPPVLPPPPNHPLKPLPTPHARDGIKMPKDAPPPPKDFFVPPVPDFSQPPPMPKDFKHPPPPPVPPPPGGPPPLP